MIIVTGGAGFIGSNFCIEVLNNLPNVDIVICDIFGSDEKWKNISQLQLHDIIKPEEIEKFVKSNYDEIEAIVHMGAISATTERDTNLIIESNFKFSCLIWNLCVEYDFKFVYASSAATYGSGENGFKDKFDINYLNKLKPINAYGWSKNLFDKWAYKNFKKGNSPSVWAGLKFFNVYGPNEGHKGSMKSMVLQSFNQIKLDAKVDLFKSNSEEYKNGMQLRDFIYVKDCIKIIIWILQKKKFGDILNVGSGSPRSFNDLVKCSFNALKVKPNIEYIDMPNSLLDQYQNYTKADISKLRDYGYVDEFLSIEDGILEYITNYLEK